MVKFRTRPAQIALLVIVAGALWLIFSWRRDISTKVPCIIACGGVPAPFGITSESLFDEIAPELRHLISRSIPSFDEMSTRGRDACPWCTNLANQDQVNGNIQWWESLSGDTISSEIRNLVNSVCDKLGWDLSRSRVKHSSKWNTLFGNGEQGIVATAGNRDTTSRLLTQISLLRDYVKCSLPIEVFVFPSELEETKPLLDEMNEKGYGPIYVTAIKGKDVVPGAWKNFHIKASALTRSRFTNVLLLDSDNLPLRDPTFLFSSKPVIETGAVFWPDFTTDSEDNPIWRILGQTASPSEFQVESGQLVINKIAQRGGNMVALLIAEAMQENQDFWFRISGGDKDTYRYAFKMLGLDYFNAPMYLASVGSPNFKGEFCGNAMLQFGLDESEWGAMSSPGYPPPLFMHANLLKHSPFSTRPGNTFKTVEWVKDPARNARIFSSALSQIKVIVDSTAGMCARLEHKNLDIFEAKTAWSGLLENLEDVYYNNGGRANGW